MDYSEAMSLGALIAAYTRQAYDINIALSAIGLYWKLADLTLTFILSPPCRNSYIYIYSTILIRKYKSFLPI